MTKLVSKAMAGRQTVTIPRTDDTRSTKRTVRKRRKNSTLKDNDFKGRVASSVLTRGLNDG